MRRRVARGEEIRGLGIVLRELAALRLGGLAALLLATAVACSSPPDNPYPDDVVENFVSGCRTRTTESVCRCAIDRLQRRYTLTEFQALEEQVAEGRGGQALAETVATCAG